MVKRNRGTEQVGKLREVDSSKRIEINKYNNTYCCRIDVADQMTL